MGYYFVIFPVIPLTHGTSRALSEFWSSSVGFYTRGRNSLRIRSSTLANIAIIVVESKRWMKWSVMEFRYLGFVKAPLIETGGGAFSYNLVLPRHV